MAYALCYDRWSSGVKLFNNNAPLFACNLSFSFVTRLLLLQGLRLRLPLSDKTKLVGNERRLIEMALQGEQQLGIT